MALLAAVGTILGVITGGWALISNLNEAAQPPPKQGVSINNVEVGDRGDGLLSLEVDLTAVGYEDEELLLALASACSPDPADVEGGPLSPLVEITIVPRTDEDSRIWPVSGPPPGAPGDTCVMKVQVADADGERLLDAEDVPPFQLP